MAILVRATVGVQTTPHRTQIFLTRTLSPTATHLFFIHVQHAHGSRRAKVQGFKTFYCVPGKSSRHLTFHRNLLGVLELFPSFSSRPSPAQSSLRTGIGTTCAGPRSGMLSGHIAEKTTFTLSTERPVALLSHVRSSSASLITRKPVASVSHDATVSLSSDKWSDGAQVLGSVKPDAMSSKNLKDLTLHHNPSNRAN